MVDLSETRAKVIFCEIISETSAGIEEVQIKIPDANEER
jgi:hypothetical protein